MGMGSRGDSAGKGLEACRASESRAQKHLSIARGPGPERTWLGWHHRAKEAMSWSGPWSFLSLLVLA